MTATRWLCPRTLSLLPVARAAVKRLRWGRKGATLQALLSCGMANEHPRAELIMREMHPAPKRPVTAPQDLGPGLEATTVSVQRAFNELFKSDFTSMDFSGWNMDLLRPVRGRADIMQPLLALVQAIANCEVPLPVFWMITTGALIATHKLAAGSWRGVRHDAHGHVRAGLLRPRLSSTVTASARSTPSTEQCKPPGHVECYEQAVPPHDAPFLDGLLLARAPRAHAPWHGVYCPAQC